MTTDAQTAVAIAARNAQWMAAFNAEDIDALLAIYDHDAVVVPPGAEPLNTPAARAAVFTAAMQTLKEVRLVTTKLAVLGSHAYENGVAHFRTAGPDGRPVPVKVDYLVVWKLGADGVWYYHIDLWWPASV